jgi:xanthine phosphoribosyltransferase
MAHATVEGVGILIEKEFQPGRKKLGEEGIEVYSLARISSMSEGNIVFNS